MAGEVPGDADAGTARTQHVPAHGQVRPSNVNESASVTGHHARVGGLLQALHCRPDVRSEENAVLQ